MKLKALTMLGLIVFAALIGTAFAATRDERTSDQTQRSEIQEHVRNHMGAFGNEEWWNKMEEYMGNHWNYIYDHWNSNSPSVRGCR